MSSIILVRHGQASFGQDNYDKLSVLGEAQAQLLGKYYGTLQRPIAQVLSGALIRQIDSATLFCGAYNTVISSHDGVHNSQNSEEPLKQLYNSATSDLFNEFYHEDIFMRSNPEFVDKGYVKALVAKAPDPHARLAELFNTAMLRWYSNEYATDYFESWQVFNTRVHRGLQQVLQQLVELKQEQGDSLLTEHRIELTPTVMVFTSGGVIASIVSQLLGGDSMLAYQINQSLVNCGVTTLSLDDDSQLRLHALNEHSHLLSNGTNKITRR